MIEHFIFPEDIARLEKIFNKPHVVKGVIVWKSPLWLTVLKLSAKKGPSGG